jgi:hypothetical protein
MHSGHVILQRLLFGVTLIAHSAPIVASTFVDIFNVTLHRRPGTEHTGTTLHRARISDLLGVRVDMIAQLVLGRLPQAARGTDEIFDAQVSVVVMLQLVLGDKTFRTLGALEGFDFVVGVDMFLKSM